jgi:hypothetical protein
MKKKIIVGILGYVLAGCGAGNSLSSGSGSAIRSTDYALPTAVPTVPDQSGR